MKLRYENSLPMKLNDRLSPETVFDKLGCPGSHVDDPTTQSAPMVLIRGSVAETRKTPAPPGKPVAMGKEDETEVLDAFEEIVELDEMLPEKVDVKEAESKMVEEDSESVPKLRVSKEDDWKVDSVDVEKIVDEASGADVVESLFRVMRDASVSKCVRDIHCWG